MARKRKKPEEALRNFLEGTKVEMDEVFECAGFRMGRLGRHIVQEVNRTQEEHQEFKDSLRGSVAEMRDSILENTKALEKILSEFDPIDLIAQLLLATAVLPSTETEAIYDPDIPPAFAEHVTLLACKRPYQKGLPFADRETINELIELLKQVFSDILWTKIGFTRETNDNQGDPELERLAFLTYMHELKVRGRAYEWHYQELITELFKPFQELIYKSLGFSYEAPSKVAEVLQDSLLKNLIARMSEAGPTEKCLLRAVDAFENALEIPKEFRDGVELLERVSKVPREMRPIVVRDMTMSWVFFGLRHAATATVAEISESSELKITVVESVLEAMSLRFGGVSVDYTCPETVSPLSKRPFLNIGSRHMLPSPCLVQPAVVGLLESCLKDAGAKKWAQYDKHRHRTVLRLAMDAMCSMMRGSIGRTELFYETSEDEQPKLCEIDGVILYGTLLFLLEVKGGALSDSARRGGERRLDRDIGNLVGDAHRQALRAKRFIASAEEVVLRNAKGDEQLVLRQSEITSIYLITVTLESAGFITAAINSRTALKAFEGSLDEFPWMVSIFDLLAISEVIDEQFVFPHFLRARIKFAKKTLSQGTDELDFLGHYFLDGLQILAENRPMMMLAATHEIDNYLYRKHGISRPRSSKPRPTVAPEMQQLLRKLSRSTSPLKVEVAMVLLDIPRERQSEFLSLCQGCLRKARRSRKSQGFSEHYKADGGTGITFIVDPALDRTRLERYCRQKKQELGARLWVGLLRSTKRGDSFHLVVLRTGPL